jgi:hypothetical protein
MRICTALALMSILPQAAADDWQDQRRSDPVFADEMNGDIVYWERAAGRYRSRTIIILEEEFYEEGGEEEGSEEEVHQGGQE